MILSFLFSIFLLLFLLLTKHVLLEHLPKLTILRSILEECLVTEIDILTCCMGTLVELSQLCYHHLPRYLEVT